MNSEQKSDAFYDKLKNQLYETSNWPSPYLYKFIVKSNLKKIAEIEAQFNNLGAVIQTKVSKKGNYTSVSVHVTMANPEAVITKYKDVAKHVKGVIAL